MVLALEKSTSSLSLNELVTHYQSENSENAKEEIDPYTTIPTWESRSKCLMAYFVLMMNFWAILRYTYSIAVYGSAIFLPYFIIIFFVGVPFIMINATLGRFVTGNFVRVFSICPISKGIFFCFFFNTCFQILIKYSILVQLFKYATTLFHGNIIWGKCSSTWAKANCYEVINNISSILGCFENHGKNFCSSLNWKSSGRQYWENVVTNPNNIESTAWTVAFLVLSNIIVVAMTYKGIRSLEKFFLFVVSVPIILAIALTMATFSIHGSVHGFKDVWFLDLSLLTKPDIWILGLEDIILKFNLGVFGPPFISSHGKFTDDIAYDIAITIFCDVFSCFILTIPLLSVMKINTQQLVLTNYVDTFIWISEGLIFYPSPNNFWAFAYYVEMLILEFGSQCILSLSVFEAIAYHLHDRFSVLCIAAIFGVITFFLTIPFALFPQTLSFPIGTGFLTSVFFSFIIIQTFYGTQKLIDDFHFMMGYHPSIIFSYTKSIAGLIILIILLLELCLNKPKTTVRHGLYIAFGIPVAIFMLTVIFEMGKAYLQNKVSKAFSVSPDWGPKIQILKKSRIIFDSNTITKEFMYRQELFKKPLMKPNDFSQQNIVHLI